ncbi:MAG: hypothetical protein Q7T30_03160 [Planctomycetota bacterium]|nr:hypothetical protein [Planctomycetota bacterium]
MPHPSPSAQRRLKRIQAAEELESAKQHGENAVNEPDLEKAHEEASKVYDTPGLRFGPIVVAGINVPAGVARDPAFNALARDLQRLDERVDSLEQRLKGVRAKRLADKESPALARMEKVLGEQVSDAKLQQEQAKQQMVKFVVAWDEANAEGHAAGANQGSGDSRRSRTGNK